ncbi:MAG TPA: histidine--tRNA ligase [Steroidobacteraceae bacterium]|nr:histidine--tRNA ligase [Steroidobacteraceae bacterium]
MNTESKLQAIRGMNDILPADIAYWQHLETTARQLFAEYGYQEMRVPVVEHTALFKRSIGELTDIVEKEMYTFVDRSGDSLTLRPEATAGLVRAMISNGLLHNQRHKIWSAGPMFRHERPQKGRYRQFYQLDVEAFGFAGPDLDAELILMTARLWKRLGIQRLVLNINSLGTPQSRQVYRDTLRTYFKQHQSQLDEDSVRRLEGNPLRILDTKNPAMKELVANAPLLTDYLDAESAAHFTALQHHLDAAGVNYVVNPRLVRGLDYYTRTVFEWVTTELGAQDAVCSGGRYDGLIEQLGGDATPAMGWALGEERIIALMQTQGVQIAAAVPQLYVVLVGDKAEAAGFGLTEQLRNSLPGIAIESNCGGGSFKTQLKRADKSGARYAIVIGDSEVEQQAAGLKNLRVDEPQVQVGWRELAAELKARLN